jgi:hypothetical protein
LPSKKNPENFVAPHDEYLFYACHLMYWPHMWRRMETKFSSVTNVQGLKIHFVPERLDEIQHHKGYLKSLFYCFLLTQLG